MERLSPMAFAVAALSLPLLTLGFGLAGFGGNSFVTAGWLLLVNCTLSSMAARLFKPTSTDCLFFAFIASCAISTFLNYDAARVKGLVLFLLCCPLPYFAGRMMRRSCIAQLPRTALLSSAAFTFISVIAIAIALVESGMSGNNRTAILGMHHAQTVFASAAGCMVIALIYSGIPSRSLLGLAFAGATYLAMTTLFLSLVRFTMLAIIASAVFSFGLMCLKGRTDSARMASFMVIACLLAAASAVFLRPFGVISVAAEAIGDTASNFASVSNMQTARAAAAVDLTQLPSCVTEINLDRSVELRAFLLKDALYLLPHSGIFGFGLDAFPSLSCLRGYQVHNIYLQTLLEFGWLAGALLIALLLSCLRVVFQVDTDHRFGLSKGLLLTNVVFFGLIGVAHGSIAGALPLFLFLGAASSVGETA